MQNMKADELRKKLHEGVVTFTYKKKDGTLRDARGTLMMDMIPKELHPKGTGASAGEMYITYYDLDSEGWRSFRITGDEEINEVVKV